MAGVFGAAHFAIGDAVGGEVSSVACRISFDKFWIGPGGDAPREEPGDDDEGFVDKVIDFVGNLGFLETFATFPVLFYDEEVGVVVFQFPPLASNIAAYRESR